MSFRRVGVGRVARPVATAGLCGVRVGLMKIAIGSDHAGFGYKERIKRHLAELGHEVVDFGTFAPEPPVDYPDFIRPAAQAVASGECERGIVLGGSGNGEAMTANRLKGVRCALCWDRRSAELAARHNDANMISLGPSRRPWRSWTPGSTLPSTAAVTCGGSARSTSWIELPEGASNPG